MDKIWTKLCRAQRVPVLDGDPGRANFIEAGYVLVKDSQGGVLPLDSFDKCDRVKNIAVFPCHTLNTRDKEQILAAAMGLISAWDGSGVVTFTFACQPDGAEYALLDARQGLGEMAESCFKLRKRSGPELVKGLEKGTLADWGAFLGLTCAGVLSGGKLCQGANVKEAFQKLPKGHLDAESLSPWYRRLMEE